MARRTILTPDSNPFNDTPPPPVEEKEVVAKEAEKATNKDIKPKEEKPKKVTSKSKAHPRKKYWDKQSKENTAIRISNDTAKLAKIKAAMKGMNMKEYIEFLIAKDTRDIQEIL